MYYETPLFASIKTFEYICMRRFQRDRVVR